MAANKLPRTEKGKLRIQSRVKNGNSFSILLGEGRLLRRLGLVAIKVRLYFSRKPATCLFGARLIGRHIGNKESRNIEIRALFALCQLCACRPVCFGNLRTSQQVVANSGVCGQVRQQICLFLSLFRSFSIPTSGLSYYRLYSRRVIATRLAVKSGR